MENPWAKLPPNAPFVLPEDRKALCDFNEKADEQHKIRLDLLPEPFSGNPEGAIVLLNLNPGYDQGDHQFHSDSAFASSLRKALCHEQQEYPLHLLNPSFCKAPWLPILEKTSEVARRPIWEQDSRQRIAPR